jgi:hypothetical protein
MLLLLLHFSLHHDEITPISRRPSCAWSLDRHATFFTASHESFSAIPPPVNFAAMRVRLTYAVLYKTSQRIWGHTP